MALIRISRHGLTACPSCGNHIKVDDDWALTTCPFCGSTLAECAAKSCAPERSRVLEALRASVKGRAGTVAASLLSLGISATSCSDNVAQPLYGLPAPSDATPADGRIGTDAERADTSAGPEAESQDSEPAETGPRDARVIDSGSVDAEPVDAPSGPDSGGRDAMMGRDSGGRDATPPFDAQVPDGTVGPLYGLPADATVPPRDAGRVTDAGDASARDSMVVPLYGHVSPDAGS